MRENAKGAVLFFAVLALASLACSALSRLPGGIGGGGDTALIRDDFSDSGSGWGTGTDPQSSVEYQNSGLHMQIFKDNFFTWSNPNRKTYKNVHMEVTVKNQSGDTRAGFGLMCNQQAADGSYYYFAVTPEGEYVIGKSEAGKDDVFLTNNDSWGSSDKIAKNASSYRLAADCGPGNLVLYVNGEKVDSAADTGYTDGAVGLFLWSGDVPSGEVTYDDFVMTQLK
ncbi:MAG: hypothetical protein ACM3MF_07805 [Anaerolineae bacterium]